MVGAFDEVFITQTLRLIEDGHLDHLPRFLDAQLASQLVPEWYKSEVLGRIYERIKDAHKQAKTRTSRERYLKAIELMNVKYGAALSRK